MRLEQNLIYGGRRFINCLFSLCGECVTVTRCPRVQSQKSSEKMFWKHASPILSGIIFRFKLRDYEFPTLLMEVPYVRSIWLHTIRFQTLITYSTWYIHVTLVTHALNAKCQFHLRFVYAIGCADVAVAVLFTRTTAIEAEALNLRRMRPLRLVE